MSPSPVPSVDDVTASRPVRVLGLDAARALAVLAMIFGHTMDAVLSSAARAEPWVRNYWSFRAFTAPLFLFVSGWVVLMLLTRRQLVGREVLRRFGPRVLLLLALGYLFRLPLWDLRGLVRLDATLWRYLLTFDALHCIATSMGVAVLLCTVVRSALGRGLALAAAAVGTTLAAPALWQAFSTPEAPALLAQTLGGGASLFPLFPWAAYFFTGGVFGLLYARAPRRTLALLSGCALLLLGYTLLNPEAQALSAMRPEKVLWRLGPVMVLLLTAMALPQRLARALSPVGRASLWAYVLHLPICYGWAFWSGLSVRVGPVLSDVEAALCAVGMVVGCALVAPALRHLYQSLPWRQRARQLAGRLVAPRANRAPVAEPRALTQQEPQP